MDTETFDKAVALREEGKYTEAADLLLSLAKGIDNVFGKAGMLLNVTHTLKASGKLDFARNQLRAVRELLSLPQDASLGAADEAGADYLLRRSG